jgi:NAD(P)-dependent dehydrogenase (short-subunit alcohol dehydrogenase family)
VNLRPRGFSVSDATKSTSKHALIMGASGGVAEAIAASLAEAGFDVALTTATNDADQAFALRRISRRVTSLGRRSMNESVDMSNGAAVQVVVRQVAKEFGGIDLLVLAPDATVDKPSERLTDADWARLVGVNLGGVLFACRGAFREMQRNDPPGGSIVLLSAGGEVKAEGAAYAAVKVGAEALVQGLSAEWAGGDIVVHLLRAPEDPADEAQLAVLAGQVLQAAIR